MSSERLLSDLEDKLFLPKRLLRLRGYVYYKIPWMETFDAIRKLVVDGDARIVEGNWIADSSVCDRGGKIVQSHKPEFDRRMAVYVEWLEKGPKLGHFAETLFAEAFQTEGYAVVKKAKVKHVSGDFEIDIMGKIAGIPTLAVEVKNILSEVILDPRVMRTPSELHQQVASHFELAKTVGMVPVLMAPFVDGSFYLCCDRNRGLFCQTLLQLFPPDEQDLCAKVKEVLHFGSVRDVSTAPKHVMDWIARIERIWSKRYG